MIAELTVENLAIIDRTQLDFSSGFTVLTGETGAGKSLLIDAIELALGERADSDVVRTGERRASVSMVFDLSSSPELRERCSELGIELEDGKLFCNREVLAEGRSQSRVSGRLTPLSVLKQIGRSLVDLHGQHDHQVLLFPERHVEYLDLWIGVEAAAAKSELVAAFDTYRSRKTRLDQLKREARDRAQRQDLLSYQVNEIVSVSPLPGEFVTAQTLINKLQHAERLSQAIEACLNTLSESEGSAIENLGTAAKFLDSVAAFDPALVPIAGQISEATILAQDAAHGLSSYVDTLEADQGALEEAANRIEALRKLRKKYGEDEIAVLDYLAQAMLELSQLENSDADEKSLEIEAEAALAVAGVQARRLTEIRRAAATRFSTLVEAQLHDLVMDRARFVVEIRAAELSSGGVDEVEFLFSANAGEPPRPFSKIASGGEVSRLMLGIKTVLAGKAGVPTLIFDEIDSGLGGRVAGTIGRKLAELGKNYQVLVISHLPQVASHASAHLKIEKTESGGRAVTRVRRLDENERLLELARMLGGETISDATLAHAREMLAEPK